MEPEYIAGFVKDPETLFKKLFEDLEWLSPKPARKEYFMSDLPRTYLYGKNDFEYQSSPFTSEVSDLMKQLGNEYNVCFLNRYDEARNALGWHADDSPEMDNEHPIAVISLGAEREIWFKTRDYKGVIPPENKQLLESGSLLIMPAGFQVDHLHKIPKNDRPCGVRISLTFRRYI